MIETIGLSALNEIRAIKGFENAVIAGGAVRDRLLGGPVKDLDIFIPCSSQEEFQAKLNYKEQVRTQFYDRESSKYVWSKFEPSNFGNFKDMKLSLTGYENKGLVAKIDCMFMGKLDCDLIAYKLPNDEKFGGNVVKDFCYHIDQAYYDGRNIITTKQFDRDAKYHEATLWYLKKVEDLPNALEKFQRLKAKYPEFTWKQTCLKLKEEEPKYPPKVKKHKTEDVVGWINELNEIEARAFDAGVQANNGEFWINFNQNN